MPGNPLSDNWRRAICRCVFLLACIFPTLITCYWIFHPQTASDWERTIQAELGLETQIDSVETPGPRVTILRGVKISDAAGSELFSTTQIRVIKDKVNRVVIEYPTAISCGSLAHLIDNASQRLQGSTLGGQSWRIEFADSATIRAAEIDTFAPLVVDHLAIDVRPWADGPEASIEFRLRGEPDATVKGYVHRGIGQRTHFGFNTEGKFLPCWLLSEFLPDLKRLGPQCQFRGSVEGVPSVMHSDQLVTSLGGEFRRLNLNTLIEPYQVGLAGECTVRVDEFAFRNGQIVSIQSSIQCDRGEISASLLAAAIDHLGFVIADSNLDRTAEKFEFRDLQLNCKLDDGRLFVGGKALNRYLDLLAFCVEQEERTPNDLALFLVQPNINEPRLTREMLAVLNLFHHPTRSDSDSSLHEDNVRVADKLEENQF